MKLVFSLLIVFSAAISALAQESTKVEVFGGYSYLRTDADLGGRRDLNGWNASVNYSLNKILGVKADFSGHYADTTFAFPFDGALFKVKENYFTFLFGPQFSYRKNEKVVPFAHVLLGGFRGGFSSSSLETGLPSFKFSDTAFSAAFGGGFDLKLTNRLAFRVVQADYLLTRFGGATQNHLRISTGLVFRF